MREIKVGDVTETVIERSDYPLDRIRRILGHETIAVLGYGPQGRGQSGRRQVLPSGVLVPEVMSM